MTLKNRNISKVFIILGGLVLILAGCGTFHVSVREVTTPTPNRSNLPGDVFADSIVLEGYSLPSLNVSANTQLPLRLYWQVIAVPPYPYAIGIGLRATDGTLVWNASEPTISWTYGQLITEHHLQFSQKNRAGNYDLEVWLYDPDSGERASVNGREADIVRMATLHLTQGNLPP